MQNSPAEDIAQNDVGGDDHHRGEQGQRRRDRERIKQPAEAIEARAIMMWIRASYPPPGPRPAR